MFEVCWTGSWPTVCSGAWQIVRDGVDVSDRIPDELRSAPMNTAGTYSAWHFENWSEVWEDYEDGLEREDWISANPWISSICETPEEMADLFDAIQSQDWRHGCCGGCI